MALRKRRGQGQGSGDDRVLVAAASKVPLDRRPTVKPGVSKQQKDALAYARSVPEVKQLLLWRSNQIAKLRLFAATHPADDEDGEPVPVMDETARIDPELARVAGEVLRDFRSPMGGQAGLLRRIEGNLESVGELWIVGFAERLPEPGNPDEKGMPPEWMVASISEIKHKPGTGEDDPGVWSVHRHPKDKVGRQIDREKGDDLFRVWMPDMEWGDLPDCALFGALGPLQQVQVLNDQLLAEARSRVPAGMFTIPSELTVGPANPAAPKEGQENKAEAMMDVIVQAWTEAVYDPSDPATLAPLLIRGPKEAMHPDFLRRIDLSRSTGKELDERIEAVLERVFRGLDAPVEVIKGHMQTTFANAEQIDDDVWEDYLEPRAVLVCDAITVGYFRDELDKAAEAAGLRGSLGADLDEQIARMFVWYDASDLVSQPNQSEGANAGLRLGAIGSQAWRKAMGFDESDAPSPTELLLRMALQRGPLAPNVVVELLRLIDPSIALPDAEGVASVGGDQSGGQPAAEASVLLAELLSHMPRAPIAALAHQKRPSDPGRDMVAIDRELRGRLLIAADQATTRALERAGNIVFSQAKVVGGPLARDRIRDLPPLERARAMGRDQLAEAGLPPEGLLSGAFDGLERQFKEWGAQSQDDAIELANRLVGGFSEAQRDALALRLASSLDEAWVWMKEALTTLATAQLFDPTPSVAEIGEFDPSLRVPPGLVRQAVARAGGSAGITTNGSGSAWITLADGGTRPTGGIATGEIIRGELRDRGIMVEAYEWDYGPALRARPFEPHRRLNHVQFSNFDSPVLANGSGWPPYPFFMPGDHDGCLCDAVPILVNPADLPEGT